MLINNLLVFEDEKYKNFLPFTYLRPVYDLVCGMATFLSKITRIYPRANISLHCRNYLKNITKQSHPGIAVNNVNSGLGCLIVNGRLLPPENLEELLNLDGKNRIFISSDDEVIAAYFSGDHLNKLKNFIDKPISSKDFINTFRYKSEVKELPGISLAKDTWDIIKRNPEQIAFDFNYLNEGGLIKGKVNYQASLLEEHRIHVGKKTNINPNVVLDARSGPIYIGESVEIDGPTLVKGPAYIGNYSTITTATILPGCSIGPGCEVTGHLEMAILHGFTKKTSPEYLGYLYAGEWVDFGMGTINQPLKDPLENIGIRATDHFDKFGPFLIGDFSRAHLNSKFEDSTYVGIASQLNGGDSVFSRQVPSFVLGTPNRFKELDAEEITAVISKKMAEKNIEYTPVEKELLQDIFSKTSFERRRH